jgi:hypothetical protein
MREILASNCEAPILNWKGHHKTLSSLSIYPRDGRAELFFLVFSSFLFIKELNNEDRWQVPDQFDQVV